MSITAITSKNLWPFSPQSIPGCQLWLDAADRQSLTLSGTDVTAWKDKSGNGYNMNTLTDAPIGYAQASPTTGTPINGLNTVNFLPGAGLQQATILDGVKNLYWVGRIDTTGVVEGGANCFFLLGHDTEYQWHADFPAGNYIDTTYSREGIRNATPVSQYGGGAAAAVNTTFSSLQFPASGSVSLVSAAGITGSTLYQGICFDRIGIHCGWSGDLAEVIIFNQALSTTQHQQVEGYLAQKWLLQENLPTTHPYYATSSMQLYKRPVFQRTFQPVDIPECVLWLDAADRQSLTLSGTDVTAWKDKSGNGNNGTATGTPTLSTAGGFGSSSPQTIYLNGSSWFLGAMSNTGTTLTAFFVGMTPASQIQNTRIVSLGSTSEVDYSSSASCIAIYQPGSLVGTYRNPSQTFGTITLNQPYITCSLYDGTSGYTFLNGSASGTSFASTGSFNISAYGVGNYSCAPIASEPFIGFMGEVIVFNTALTTSQRQQVESYLAWKWGLTSLLPSTHPGKLLPSFSTVFTPKSLTGLQLWLDAADSSTITGTSTVTEWADKSGNGNNATATGSPTLAQNSINGVQSIATGSGNYFNGSISITGTTFTCFAVATTTLSMPLSSQDQRLVSLANGTNTDWGESGGAIALFNESGTNTIATYRVYTTRGSNPIIQNTPFLAVGQDDGTNAYLWYNGSAGTLPSSASSGTFAITKYGIGNQANPTVEYWVGNIGEVIIFNTALTTSQRQQVEGYLAWKWGLQNNLPDTHAYKKIKP
jgi:hypothetical protein